MFCWNRRKRYCLLSLTWLFCLTGLLTTRLTAITMAADADDMLSPDLEISVVVDLCVDRYLQKLGLTPAPLADDLTILRRTTLDLAGRIPASTEYSWYIQQPEAGRRMQWVDWLMSLPDSDLHLRNTLHELLLANKPRDTEFRDYLLWAVRERRPWDQMFRDMLLGRDTEAPQKGAAQFLKSRVRELDELTNDASILFFGVNISCARCHDHPLVADWKQDHFYGMQSFFSRTFATRRNVLTEKPFGEVRFKTTEGEEKTAALMFLSGSTVEDRTPKFEDEERRQLETQIRKLQNDENAGYILFPDFSPRQALIELAMQDQQHRYLAKNIVNRIWATLLGTGLVDPPDQMHSGNPSNHPELLQWLAEDLTAHGYDLRRLIRGLVLSQTYARSGEWTAEASLPAADTFAVAAARPLTPRQLGISLLIAVRHPQQWPSPEELQSADASQGWQSLRNELENQAGGWADAFEQPAENFQVAVDEALYLSNNERIQQDLLRDSGDRLIGWSHSVEDHQQLVRQIWISVLSRLPSADELELGLAWMDRESVDRTEAVRTLIWSLLAGPEFRFNH